MSAMASQITSLTIVYSTSYSGAAQIKENIEAPRHWSLWGEFTGDRWIPRTNGQKRRQCFHLMTSSWYNSNSHGATYMTFHLNGIHKYNESMAPSIYYCHSSCLNEIRVSTVSSVMDRMPSKPWTTIQKSIGIMLNGIGCWVYFSTISKSSNIRCIFLLQSGVLWDMGLRHGGICATGLYAGITYIMSTFTIVILLFCYFLNNRCRLSPNLCQSHLPMFSVHIIMRFWCIYICFTGTPIYDEPFSNSLVCLNLIVVKGALG